jgi:hypothetical protein
VLLADLDRWLVYYNSERPHLGYRNLGKCPSETVNAYLSVTKKASQYNLPLSRLDKSGVTVQAALPSRGRPIDR